jgi:hypothetical protein
MMAVKIGPEISKESLLADLNTAIQLRSQTYDALSNFERTLGGEAGQLCVTGLDSLVDEWSVMGGPATMKDLEIVLETIEEEA